jgi:cellobiose-specific phosphotransferase system component IIB
VNIDNLPVTKSLIDLTGVSTSSFDSVFVGYDLNKILDDVILAEFVDTPGDKDEIVRNGIIVKTNAMTNAWRLARVILLGPNCKIVKKNDIIMFPNNMGVQITKITVTGYGNIKNGIFINEQRIFGVCQPQKNENKSRSVKNNIRNKRS